MKKLIRTIWASAALLLLCSIGVVSASEAETPSKWDTAGQKVKDASVAVGDASAESMEQAVEDARLAWEEAKKASQESIDAAKKKYDEEKEKGRAIIHEATAPTGDTEPEVQETTPQN